MGGRLLDKTSKKVDKMGLKRLIHPLFQRTNLFLEVRNHGT